MHWENPATIIQYNPITFQTVQYAHTTRCNRWRLIQLNRTRTPLNHYRLLEMFGSNGTHNSSERPTNLSKSQWKKCLPHVHYIFLRFYLSYWYSLCLPTPPTTHNKGRCMVGELARKAAIHYCIKFWQAIDFGSDIFFCR